MAEKSEEEVDLDQDDATSESNGTTDSQNDGTSDDDTTDEWKKNSSNWKKMSEAKKELERTLRHEREEKLELQAELWKLKEWANSLYEDPSQKPFTKKEEVAVEDATSRLEQKIFLLENKEAKEHLDAIQSARTKYHMDFEEAWTFVQAKLPPESKSKKDFDLSEKTTKLPKDITKLSMEDALTLSKADQAKWRKANGME